MMANRQKLGLASNRLARYQMAFHALPWHYWSPCLRLKAVCWCIQLGPASLGPATAEYEDGLCRYRHCRPDMFCQPGSRCNANCSRYCMHLVLACWLCCAATLSLHRTAPHPPAVSFRSAHSMRCTTCCKRRLCCLPT